jgi:hypothetical protein
MVSVRADRGCLAKVLDGSLIGTVFDCLFLGMLGYRLGVS